MGWDLNPLHHNGKRVRDPEDAVYLDNYQAHKRYLSEVMASSLNGLTVGDSLTDGSRMSPSRFDPMDSPARTEIVNFSRDDLAAQDSPMSEDSDDCISYRTLRYSDSPHHISTTQSDQVLGSPTSPVSPQRNQKIINGIASHFGSSSFTSSGGTGSSSLVYTTSFPVQYAQSRQRNSESESRFPPSPSDPCQSADLRRAALLRSLQMRAQPPAMPSFEMSVDSISEQGMHHIEVAEDQSSPFVKSFSEHNEFSFASPVHGIYSSQAIRGSARVRSLLLDDCSLSSSASMSGLSTPSQQKGNIKSKTKTCKLAPKAKEA